MSNDNASINFNDVIYGHKEALRYATRQLSGLASAFSRTGNTAVADEINEVCAAIEASMESLDDAYGDKLHDDLCRSDEATHNVVKAALAGIAIGGRKG